MCIPKFRGGMGFKDFSYFNLSFLAKQGWRISQNETSLLHKIYQARYFPNSSLFDSHLSANPSYLQRGIWQAKKWLEKGCIQRIGDGTKVCIWKDSWILGVNQPLTPHEHVDLDPLVATVDHLFDKRHLGWNVQTLNMYFPPSISIVILKILLGSNPCPDSVVPIGSFNNVKSNKLVNAYRLPH